MSLVTRGGQAREVAEHALCAIVDVVLCGDTSQWLCEPGVVCRYIAVDVGDDRVLPVGRARQRLVLGSDQIAIGERVVRRGELQWIGLRDREVQPGGHA